MFGPHQDALAEGLLLDRHGQPARRAVHQDGGAVLVVLLLELHVIEHHEQVHLPHAVQVAEPGQEVGLVYSDDHPGASVGETLQTDSFALRPHA
jgi:hypothetical protein